MAKRATSAAPRSPRATLRATDVPGVFRNRAGVLVDLDGLAVVYKDLKKADDDDYKQVLGRPAETALDVMKATYRDPRNPRHVRFEAAKHAAPYESPKLMSHQGAPGAPPIATLDMTNWSLERILAYEAGLQAAKAAAGDET